MSNTTAPKIADPSGPWIEKVRRIDRTMRGHAFLPLDIARKIPALWSQDGKGMEAMAHVRYFGGGSAVWYVTEYDPATGEAFGWADLFGDSGELGYLSMEELGTLRVPPLNLPIERDCHWSPRPLSQCAEVAKR